MTLLGNGTIPRDTDDVLIWDHVGLLLVWKSSSTPRELSLLAMVPSLCDGKKKVHTLTASRERNLREREQLHKE